MGKVGRPCFSFPPPPSRCSQSSCGGRHSLAQLVYLAWLRWLLLTAAAHAHSHTDCWPLPAAQLQVEPLFTILAVQGAAYWPMWETYPQPCFSGLVLLPTELSGCLGRRLPLPVWFIFILSHITNHQLPMQMNWSKI